MKYGKAVNIVVSAHGHCTNMKVSVLASGSKGNSTYIETEKTKCLLDIGPTTSYIETKLQELKIDPKEIKSLIITHTHIDHIGGLPVFLKRYNPKVYLTEIMHKELKNLKHPIVLTNYEYIKETFQIEDITITPIKLSHDTEDANGYIFDNKQKSLVYITDTGYIHIKNHEKLKNKNLYIMESNHDIEMLMNGHYPYHIKQRILGDRGHLSNKDSAYYLSKFIGENTKTIILAHLSEENNTQDLALQTAKKALTQQNQEIQIQIAYQDKTTELIEV